MTLEKQIAKACALHERALQARAQGNFADALSLGQRALRLLEQAEGRDHPDVANVLNHMGATHADRGDLVKAEKLHRRAVKIMEEISENDPDLDRLRVHSLNGLGTVYRMAGRYSEAIPLFEQALALAERAFGADDLEVATTLNNLGVLGKFAGRFAQAGKAYRRALRIVEKAYGAVEDSLSSSERQRAGLRKPSTGDADLQYFLATLYHNLGGLEHARGRCAAGEPFARLSVELREKTLGPDNPAVAEDVAALAALLDGQAKFEEAEKLYHRALAIFERVRGPECYDVAVNLNNLAAIRHQQGRLPEAEELYRRALAIKEKLLGRSHPDTAMTLNNLAVTCQAQGDKPEARRLFQRALKIFAAKLGPKHPHTVACRQSCARMAAKSTESRL